jgi:SacI homology domain/Inositol phosphatase
MAFLKAGFPSAIMPIMQGFVGQQPFIVKNTSEDKTHTEAFQSLESVLKADGVKLGPDGPAHGPNCPQPFLLTLISRRSVKRSGLRYLRRGIDDEGNCANTVETEQILSSPTWENPATIRSFAQIRASIPLYFSQSPYAFKPVPVLHQSPEINRKAFDRHFEELRRRYGFVQIVLLVDKQGGEKRIGEEYEKVTKASNESGGTHELGFEWFDFHTECRGMKFENVQKLVHAMEDIMNSFGETVVDGPNIKQRQTGIIRTNCMDCLDRTNVVQSAFAQHMLQKDLEKDGLEIDFVHDPSTQWFNTLWADNGDAISRQYASTAALKGDYTRTRKRDYRGALNDFGLTLTRYYNNIVNDYFSQTVIDVLLGNVTPRIFDEFEASMMSADPGVSIDKLRQNAIDTCSKIVIQHPEEDLIHGWAMLTPAQTDTLRTLPFEEAILLLTDHAIYGCKFDWNTEKVASFERIDLRSVTKIYCGTYITSTLTEGQMNEDLNVGLVISYTPGKESIKRVNTRSLQFSADTEAEGENEKGGKKDQGTGESGILSWLHTRNPQTSHCMAMKVIPNRPLAEEKIDSCPLATAERICSEIQRTIIDSIGQDGKYDLNLIEKADIISLADARSRTGYLEQIGHSIKKLVWT